VLSAFLVAALAAFEKKKAASKGKWGGQAQGQRQGRKHKKIKQSSSAIITLSIM
jgi:hypothetical protein